MPRAGREGEFRGAGLGLVWSDADVRSPESKVSTALALPAPAGVPPVCGRWRWTGRGRVSSCQLSQR